jgi:hypothetical protein
MKSAFNSDTGKMAYRQVTLFDMVAKGV